ncbi:hypothetical protein LUZ60_012484 [Juncus effusus]|nr:hypothetical protein LUZ60_012484 [Juncus effusus]
MPRVPLIKFPVRHPPKPSVAAASASDKNAFSISQLAKPNPKPPTGTAGTTGTAPSYRFRSDVPSPPSNNALGGKASLLPKRTPLSEEEIEAIMLGGQF